MLSSQQQSSNRCNRGKIRYVREKRQRRYPKDQMRQKQEQQKIYQMMIDRAASAHEYAQKLNNVAAMSIDIGQYDQAIATLAKALKLSELHLTDQLLDRSCPSSCCYSDTSSSSSTPTSSSDAGHECCSLDGCILHSENISNLLKEDLFHLSSNKNSNKKNTGDRVNISDDDDDAILHRTPIRIPKRSIREGHNMGSTLFLIITFNLALAHHLKILKTMTATATTPISSSSSSTSIPQTTPMLISSTVQLYELANSWQNTSAASTLHQRNNTNYVVDSEEEYDDDDDMSFLSTESDDDDMEATPSSSHSFNMILSNNVSHLNQLGVLMNHRNNTVTTYTTTQSRLDEMAFDVVSNNTPQRNPYHQTEEHHHEQAQPTTQLLTATATTTSTNTRSSCTHHSSGIVSVDDDDDDLEFEYYNDEEDEDDDDNDVESYNRQHVDHHHYCSSSSEHNQPRECC